MIASSVVIVNWNTRHLLEKCLHSLTSQTVGVSFDVWVVDNASSDGSSRMVTSEFPGVRLIRNKKNAGFAAANNQAILASSGRYVLLLNSDTEVIGNAICELVGFMDEHESVGALGCKLLNPDGSLQPSCHGFATIFRSFSYATGFHSLTRLGSVAKLLTALLGPRLRSWTHFANYDRVLFPDKVDGACMLLRRKALEEVGLLDETFFMYFEEEDLCYRLLQHGWLVAYTPSAKVMHYRGQSTNKAYRAMAIEYYKSGATFFEKHYGPRSARSFRTAVLFGTVIRLLVSVPGLVLGLHGSPASCSNCMGIIRWALRPEAKNW